MPVFRFATVALIVLLFTRPSAAADPDERVRASHPRLAHLLLIGEQRSATFRDLIDRLRVSDVIVHLEGAPPGHPIDGGLQFVGVAGLARYVRVTLRTDLPADELMALMGHELRHAVEVAESPEIRDESSFRSYYERQGRARHRGRHLTYDTRAAVEAGQRVAMELRMSHAFHTTGTTR